MHASGALLLNPHDINKSFETLAGASHRATTAFQHTSHNNNNSDEHAATNTHDDWTHAGDGGFDAYDDDHEATTMHNEGTRVAAPHTGRRQQTNNNTRTTYEFRDVWRELNPHSNGNDDDDDDGGNNENDNRQAPRRRKQPADKPYRAGKTWRAVAAVRARQQKQLDADEAHDAVSLPLFTTRTLPEFAAAHRRAAAARRRRRRSARREAETTTSTLAPSAHEQQLWAEPFADQADFAAHGGGFDAYDDDDDNNNENVVNSSNAMSTRDDMFGDIVDQGMDLDEPHGVERVLFAGLDQLQDVPTETYETLCKQHVEQYMSMCNQHLKQTELSRRIAHWTARYDY